MNRRNGRNLTTCENESDPKGRTHEPKRYLGWVMEVPDSIIERTMTLRPKDGT